MPTTTKKSRGQRHAAKAAILAKKGTENLDDQVAEFASTFQPLERERLHVLADARTGANYCECHIRAARLIDKATIDVPLDPDEQPEYRANRELVEDHVAFEKMREDALARRTFSNIVAEYTTTYDPAHPLKVIGGQHRYTAIREAFDAGVDELHGVKVYFGLDNDQRLDVQLISNTNIAVSTDLFDRMQETLAGPDLRDWCQTVGLLPKGRDFADKRDRSRPITVRAARTFIVNYFRGREITADEFESVETTPHLCKTGVPDPDWELLKKNYPKWHNDVLLRQAGTEFAALVEAQRNAFASVGSKGHKLRTKIDFAEKALNYALLSSWAFVAGLLHKNPTRRERHFALKDQSGRDPLNAQALAKGRHRSDPENYRGLGYRTDAKERGRFVELFYLQAEKGEGLSAGQIDLAIKKYHAKQARLEVLAAEDTA